MTEHKGGCLCGAIRYTVTQDLTDVAVCHCTHCQKQGGAAFSSNLLVAKANYHQTGETKVFQDKGDSGQPVYRHFCANCGSPIASFVAVMPDAVIIKAGTLDDMSGLKPVIEVYTDHAVSWLPPTGAQLRFPQAAG
jgi:hypothetical protein